MKLSLGSMLKSTITSTKESNKPFHVVLTARTIALVLKFKKLFFVLFVTLVCLWFLVAVCQLRYQANNTTLAIGSIPPKIKRR